MSAFMSRYTTFCRHCFLKLIRTSFFHLFSLNYMYIQDCYLLCKKKILDKLYSQLNLLFIAHSPDMSRDTMEDTSIAYGCLVRACQLECSDHYSEALCEEVGITIKDMYICILSPSNCVHAVKMYKALSWPHPYFGWEDIRMHNLTLFYTQVSRVCMLICILLSKQLHVGVFSKKCMRSVKFLLCTV